MYKTQNHIDKSCIQAVMHTVLEMCFKKNLNINIIYLI